MSLDLYFYKLEEVYWSQRSSGTAWDLWEEVKTWEQEEEWILDELI